MIWHIQARWRSRDYDTVSGAPVLAQFLRNLDSHHPLLRDWRYKASSKAESLESMVPYAEDRSLLAHLGEKDGDQLLFDAWNGRENERSATMTLVTQPEPKQYAPTDNLFVQLGAEAFETLAASDELIAQLLLIFIKSWSPDWISVLPLDVKRSIIREEPSPEVWMGWRTYLSSAIAAESRQHGVPFHSGTLFSASGPPGQFTNDTRRALEQRTLN